MKVGDVFAYNCHVYTVTEVPSAGGIFATHSELPSGFTTFFTEKEVAALKKACIYPIATPAPGASDHKPVYHQQIEQQRSQFSGIQQTYFGRPTQTPAPAYDNERSKLADKLQASEDDNRRLKARLYDLERENENLRARAKK